MIMMLIYASTCVTLVCNHTNIAWIWNWYRVVTEGDDCLFLVQARPEVCVGSVGYRRQWWKFPVIFLVWRLLFRIVVIVYSCKLWRGWRKVFLDVKCHVILKTSALIILCSNKGGESALPSLGSGACRGDILYCEKLWWRWFNTMILL